MKFWIVTLCGLVAAVGPVRAAEDGMPASAESAPANWNATIASDARYFSWDSDRGSPSTTAPTTGDGHGWQYYVPFALQIAGQPNENFQLSVLGRGGWVKAEQSTAGLTGKVETMTDTAVTGNLAFVGLAGVQPFVALSVNVPTGRSALRGTGAFARMDPDLVEIASYGEGLNFGPTFGASIPITSTILATVSVGHTWRGEFVRESSIDELDPSNQASSDVDPGGVWTFTGGLGYQGESFAANVALAVSEEDETEVDGVPLYKPGRRFSVTGGAAFDWPLDLGTTTLSGAWAHGERNQVLFLGGSALVAEPFNTNSDVWRVGLEHLVPAGPIWLGPVGSFLSRADNSYDATTLQFVPQKERWSAGALVRAEAGEHLVFKVQAEHVWTHEHERRAIFGQQFSVLANAFIPGSGAVPNVSSEGWQIVVGANVGF